MADMTCGLVGPHQFDTSELYKYYHMSICQGFTGSSDGKESTCNVEDLGFIPGLRSFLEKEMATSLQFSCRRIPIDSGADGSVHGVTKSRT